MKNNLSIKTIDNIDIHSFNCYTHSLKTHKHIDLHVNILDTILIQNTHTIIFTHITHLCLDYI